MRKSLIDEINFITIWKPLINLFKLKGRGEEEKEIVKIFNFYLYR